MDVFLIEYQAHQDSVDKIISAAKEFVAAIAADNDPDVRYRSSRKNDGVSFVHIAEFTDDAAKERLQSTAHFKKFSEALPSLCAVKPSAQKLEVVADSRG
ncbi:MAG: antibiotic biosynthesis monooxygenase [Desulfatiglandales bacterium]